MLLYKCTVLEKSHTQMHVEIQELPNITFSELTGIKYVYMYYENIRNY